MSYKKAAIRLDKNPTTNKRKIEVLDIDQNAGLPRKLARLRYRLYHKAKKEPKFRFYTLYDRIYQKEVLEFALRKLSRKKDKAAGIDGVKIRDVLSSETKRHQFIDNLHEELRAKKYKPQPVLRRYIPKARGKLRPLGIPTLKDKVVQKATVLVIEAIFEADFKDNSYGYRPGKSSNEAVKAIRNQILRKKTEVYDADLKGFFDNIPHDNLLKAVEKRISDRSVLKMIKQWLEAPIIEPDQRGAAGKNRKGTPQGGVISSLLANIYMNLFDHLFHKFINGGKHWNPKLIRYADDFVIIAQKIEMDLIDWVEKTLEGRFKLPINREKTTVIRLNEPKAKLSFVGFTFQYIQDKFKSWEKYPLFYPSKKAEMKIRDNIREVVTKRRCFVPLKTLIKEVNAKLRGWSNYFKIAKCYTKKSFQRIDHYVYKKLLRHSKKLSQRHYRKPKDVSFYRHLAQLGRIRINAKRLKPSYCY